MTAEEGLPDHAIFPGRTREKRWLMQLEDRTPGATIEGRHGGTIILSRFSEYLERRSRSCAAWPALSHGLGSRREWNDPKEDIVHRLGFRISELDLRGGDWRLRKRDRFK